MNDYPKFVFPNWAKKTMLKCENLTQEELQVFNHKQFDFVFKDNTMPISFKKFIEIMKRNRIRWKQKLNME